MWFWLSLLSSASGAVETIITKKALHNVSPAILSWTLFALTLPIYIVWVIIEGKFNLNAIFFISATASSILYVFGKTLSNTSIKKGLVSHIFPLTAFSGLFTYIFGLVFLQEHIALFPLFGLFIIIIGAYLLNVEAAKEHILKPLQLLFTKKESLLFLLSLLLTSACAMFDKTAIKQSTPAMTLLVENIIMLTLLTPYLTKKNPQWFGTIKTHFPILFLNSLIFALMSLLVFFAIIDGPIALVAGVKRSQIFFVLLLSTLLLKEKVRPSVWLASAIMAAGVILIKIG
jgi:uncharacterized membrane protein